MRRLALFICLVFPALISASEDGMKSFITGNHVKKSCNHIPDWSDPAVTMCISYIAGSIDTHTVLVRSGSAKKIYCLPSHTTGEQLYLIVNKFMQENPQHLHHVMSDIVAVALSNTFPCGEGEG